MATTPHTDPGTREWISEPSPRSRRLAHIRQVAGHVLPTAPNTSIAAMLRDLQFENDRLTQAASVQRAEVLCEAAEIMLRCGLPQAADLLNAQVLLEFCDHGAPLHLRAEAHARVLGALAAFTSSAGLKLTTDGNCTSLTAAAGVDHGQVMSTLDDIAAYGRVG